MSNYTIIFTDNSVFKGGDINNSLWNTMPNKPILKLIYKILDKTITLENYESYNHLVEHISFLQNNKKMITKVILMVKKGNDVMKLICDLTKNKIYPDVAVIGKEYQGKPVTGWKLGIKNKQPKTTIN